MNQTQDTGEDDAEENAESTEGEGVTPGATAERLTEVPPDETIEEIEQERERRLADENRPEGAVIDNSDATLPTVEAFAEAERDESGEGVVGTSDPSEIFKENPPSEEEQAEIEEERKRRLDPGNRPENTEIDNTQDPPPAAHAD